MELQQHVNESSTDLSIIKDVTSSFTDLKSRFTSSQSSIQDSKDHVLATSKKLKESGVAESDVKIGCFQATN